MSNPKIPLEFIKKIPKTDLHVHLDGSVRVETIVELAKKQKITLPADTVEGLKGKVFKSSYKDLVEYLECFKYTLAVMNTAENIERISYEFACDNYDENVRYFEVRFSPQLLASRTLSMEQVLLAVNNGLKRAKDEYNKRIRGPDDCPVDFEYAIICTAMRFFNRDSSQYFADLHDLHPHESPERLYSLASMALATTASAMKHTHKLPITAIDIAGAERGFPASIHEPAFQYAHKHFLSKTCHAGEAYGPESIFQACQKLNADRIGHGVHIFDEHLVKEPGNGMTVKQYVDGLVEYIAHKRITVEVCLTSNRQTIPRFRESISQHPFRRMLAERFSLSLNTDNRTVSQTSVTQEIALACESFDLSPQELQDIIFSGFKRSFFPMDYPEKEKYFLKIIDYYKKLEAEYGLDTRENSVERVRS